MPRLGGLCKTVPVTFQMAHMGASLALMAVPLAEQLRGSSGASLIHDSTLLRRERQRPFQSGGELAPHGVAAAGQSAVVGAGFRLGFF